MKKLPTAMGALLAARFASPRTQMSASNISHFEYGQSPLTNFSLEPNSATNYLMLSAGVGFGW